MGNFQFCFVCMGFLVCLFLFGAVLLWQAGSVVTARGLNCPTVQLLSPCAVEPVLPGERSPRNEMTDCPRPCLPIHR